jgi:NADH:ubiquinone oxidoreductase subunit E
MTTEVKICMGSACFAKGNQENLEYIKEYIEENNLEADISIIGALCENKCEIGPRIIINEKEYTNVTKEQIKEVLDSYKKILNLN